MTYSLRVAPRAWTELQEAVDWYEAQREGLGAELTQAIEDALSDIMAGPSRWPSWQPDAPYRRRVVQRFPYVVFYALEGPVIRVVAIAHTKRHPGYWLR